MDYLRRGVFLPILVSNAYSLFGVFFWNWSVADIFFWFWCEFVLSGIMSFVLMMFWRHTQKDLPKGLGNITPGVFGFSFLYILFFATLFTAMAYKGEWKTYDRFPQFLADKEIGLLATMVSYAVFLIMTLSKPDRGLVDSNHLAQPFNRKCFVVLGIYLIFLVHGWIREWTTDARLNLSPAYLKTMGMTLLSLKLIAELGIFDHFFKRQVKRSD